MTASDVAEYVADNPGVHFSDLVKTLGVTPDKLQRLGERLETERAIVVDTLYGKTHFYPPEYGPWERKAIALVRRETSREILFYLLERETATPAEVAEHVGIARSTLEWHVDRLVDADLVSKDRDGWRVQLRVRQPTEIRRVLEELHPTLPERWLDRTSRLLDHLLEDS